MRTNACSAQGVSRSASVGSTLDRARAYAARVPGAIAGQDGHGHTFALACQLKQLGCTPDQALEVLSRWNRTCLPPWSDRELIHKVDSAFGQKSGRKANGFRTATSKIEPDMARIRVLCDSGLNRQKLESENMGELDGPRDCAETYLRFLFPGDPLLCCGRTQFDFDCMRLSDWGERPRIMQFLVPSPAVTREGLTKSGNVSRHAQSMFPARHYLVVESDILTHDEQAAVLLHLGRSLPLILVVDSGGKSLHGYFDARGIAEGQLLRFFRYARLHGADPTGWQIEAFKRMPGGCRQNGARQQVIFLNPLRKLYV